MVSLLKERYPVPTQAVCKWKARMRGGSLVMSDSFNLAQPGKGVHKRTGDPMNNYITQGKLAAVSAFRLSSRAYKVPEQGWMPRLAVAFFIVSSLMVSCVPV